MDREEWMDGWLGFNGILSSKHASSGYIMPEEVYSLLVRPMVCTKEIIDLRLG